MAETASHKSGVVKTSDGVDLAWEQHGDTGKPNIVFIPGWCQTALQWRKQYEDLKQHFHITTYDHRGYGSSQKTERGYRISRFAADLNDVLTQLDLKDVTLVGHSMGCSIIWSYWELFAGEHHRIKNLVLVDQSPSMLPRPGRSEEQAKEIGSIFTHQSFDEFVLAIESDARVAMSQFVPSMFTDTASREDIDWTVERNLSVDPKNAATLLLDHVHNDWRDAIETINIPTLVFGATGSNFPLSGLEWVKNHISGAQFVPIDKEEGGSHFMFWENPEKFNSLLRRFVETGDIAF